MSSRYPKYYINRRNYNKSVNRRNVMATCQTCKKRRRSVLTDLEEYIPRPSILSTFPLQNGSVSTNQELESNSLRRLRPKRKKLSRRMTIGMVSEQKKKRLLAEYESFSKEVHIPGLRETATSKNRTLKIIWAVLLLLALSVTIFFIYGIVMEFLNVPTATKIKRVHQKLIEFPPIYVCLNEWKNDTKLLERNLTKNGIKYLYSLMNIEMMKKPDYGLLITDEEYKMGKTDFEQFAEKENLRYYEEALLLGSVDFKDGHGGIVSNDFTSFERVFAVGLGKLCYKLIIPIQTLAKSSKSDYQLTLRAPIFAMFNMLLIGVDYRCEGDDSFQAIHSGYGYKLQINAQKEVLLDKVTERCLKEEEVKSLNYSQKYCFHKCMSDKRVEGGYNCKTMVNGEEIFDVSRKCDVCSSIHGDHVKRFPNVTDFEVLTGFKTESFIECQRICLEPCEEILYHLTSSYINIPNRLNNPEQTVLNFILAYAKNGMIVLEETSTYSFQSAVSNIGGQLGLWMGLSIMTVFQIIHYFVNKCFKEKTSET